MKSKIRNAIWPCQQNQLCFVHIFLILVCCRIATMKRNSYKACDEEMLKPLLILTLLKIISRYYWYIDLVNNRCYITLLTSSCIRNNTISGRNLFTITEATVVTRFVQQNALKHLSKCRRNLSLEVSEWDQGRFP